MIAAAWTRRVAALAVAAGLLVGACGATAPSGGTAAPSGGPAASLAASDQAPAPSGTPWPGDVPDAIIGLGAADAQIAAAGQAMDAAIAAKDLETLASAADGLVVLVDGNAKYVATAQGYPGTKQVADGYATAFAKLRAGASDISAGVNAGDATRVNTGLTELGDGIAVYGLARKSIGDLVNEALSQKRKYVK